MLSFTLSGNISMENHQWRLSQAYTYAYSYNFNYLSITYTLPIACQSFSVTCSMSLTYPFIYTFSVFLYLSCVHLSRLSYVFFNVPILFQVTYHVSSLCFFSSFGSMIYCILCTITYTSHTFVRSYSVIYFVLSYTFFTCLVLT